MGSNVMRLFLSLWLCLGLAHEVWAQEGSEGQELEAPAPQEEDKAELAPEATPKGDAPTLPPAKAGELTTPQDVVSTGHELVNAIKMRDTTAILGLLAAIALYVLRLRWREIPPKYLPYAMLGGSLAISVLEGLSAGLGLEECLVNGLLMYGVATGAWGLAKPFLRNSVTPQPPSKSPRGY